MPIVYVRPSVSPHVASGRLLKFFVKIWYKNSIEDYSVFCCAIPTKATNNKLADTYAL